MMSMNLSDIAILNIKSDDYRCIFSGISKNEATSLMQNADLTENTVIGLLLFLLFWRGVGGGECIY